MWFLEKYADNVVVVNELGETLTYGDLLISAENLATQISGRCLIFCLCRNCVGSLLGYVTFINNGIVPLLLDAQIERQLLINLTETYKPDYFWIHSDMESDFESYEAVYSDYNYTLMKTSYNYEYPLFKELALLLTTSGSTGSRKLVRLSYANIKANMVAIAKYLEIDETERSITTLPMNYTYGLSIINIHLHAGALLIMTEKTIVQKEFWQQFKAYGSTSFSGVPYTYEMLNRMRFIKMKLPALRTMTQAGGKLLPALHKKFAEYARDTGKRFYVMYGQTEATARMSYLPYQKSVEKYGSIGIAIPGGKFSLIDVDEMEITEPEITGELVYEGPNVTLGYAEQGQDLARGDERHGRLVTGDMAKMDGDGFYYIVGRKKRFLKIFGNRVNLDETEQLLKARFKEAEVACSGVDDKMYIFITEGTLVQDLRQYITDKTGLNHIAFAVKHINNIPKNESGKTIYEDLEQYFN
jgi:long-chain acyl-CoA synthetase